MGIATGANAGTDVNGDGKNDVVVADEGTNQIGVLLNSGRREHSTGHDRRRGRHAPSGVVLGNYTGHVSTTTSPAVLDAAVSNDSTTGGGVTSSPTMAQGFSRQKRLILYRRAQIAVADGNFDGTALSRHVEQHRASPSLTPRQGPSRTLSRSGDLDPVAMVVDQFGGGRISDIAVLNANGTIEFFEIRAPPGSCQLRPNPCRRLASEAGAVSMTSGRVTGNGTARPGRCDQQSRQQRLVILQNTTSTTGTPASRCSPITVALDSPVQRHARSGPGGGDGYPEQHRQLRHLSRHRRRLCRRRHSNESMVAVFQNLDNGSFARISNSDRRTGISTPVRRIRRRSPCYRSPPVRPIPGTTSS